MKIIEAMKKIKDLQKKAEDIRGKIERYASDTELQSPVYDDQREKVRQWLQSHEDIMKEICDLRCRIQRTNAATDVSIMFGGKAVKKTISAWIHRRRDLAALDMKAWNVLDNLEKTGRVQEGRLANPDGTNRDIKIRRYYNPEERDKKIELYRSEPLQIDAALEVVNAVTELTE